MQLAVRNTIKQQMKNKQGKLRRLETNATDASAAMGLAMSAMMCEDAGDEFAGIGPAPKHYNAVFGRPHEGKWVAVMDKGVIKVFGMGTWEIVHTRDIHVMNTCFSFKVKSDNEGNTTEYHLRTNADG